jgi:ABC-2 type transport system ATP-binding protein
MALMHRPPLLLLDEVTTGVDIRTRSRLLQTVTTLAEEGAAVCYSTHYLPEVEELDATVAIIDDGRLLARGGHQELVARHAAAALEVTFDGAAPDLDAALVAPGAVSRPRDEVVRIATAEPGATAAQVLAGLGAEAERVRNVEIITGDLDSVFLAITGRRYVSDDAGDGDGDGPDPDGPVRTAEELA